MKDRAGLLLILLSLTLALGWARATSEYTWQGTEPETTNHINRLKALIDNRQEISRTPGATTLFFGNSIFEYFLDPRDYDAARIALGSKSVSYNLAFAGIMGLGTLALAEQVANLFAGNKEPFREVVFELSPASYGSFFYDVHDYSLNVDRPSGILSVGGYRGYLRILRDQPVVALQLLLHTLIRPTDWSRSDWIQQFFGKPPKNQVRLAVPDYGHNHIFGEWPRWRLQTRGMTNWNRPAKNKEYENLLSTIQIPENWNAMLAAYSNSNMIGPRFHYAVPAVQNFIAAVKVSREYSSRQIILVLPYAPSFRALTDPYVNTKVITDWVARETGATVIDLQNALPLTDADFADAMHPRNETMKRLLEILARRLAQGT